jgi:ABC-type amino acid transport system permease subunit
MRVLPALASSWVALFKDTSLVSTMELSYVSLQIRAQTFRILEVLTAMAAIYMRLRLYPRVAVARTDSSSAGFFRTSSYLKARLDLWLELMDENR